MKVIDTIASDPVYSAITVIVLTIVGIVSRVYLGPQSDWVEAFKQKWVTKLDPILSIVWRSFLRQKTNDEYVCSTTILPDAVEKALHHGGYTENDLSSVKYRVLPDGTRQYNAGQLKFSEPNSSRQWHVYLFPGYKHNGTDCYQHGEADWDPSEGGGLEQHLNSDQISGDPESVLRDVLDAQGVSYEVDEQFNQTEK